MKQHLLAAGLCLAVAAPAFPQALTSLASVRVGYNTRKNTVKPQGELKAQIDALDQQIANATRLGRNGELRRLFAKGVTLLSGRQWTDALDYGTSLVIRTDHVVSDSAKPLPLRLEQMYQPSIALEHTLAAPIVLPPHPAPTPVTPGTPPQPPAVVKELGTFEGVGRDLRESPFPFELDVHDVADGTYLLTIEVGDNGTTLGTAMLGVTLRKGL